MPTLPIEPVVCVDSGKDLASLRVDSRRTRRSAALAILPVGNGGVDLEGEEGEVAVMLLPVLSRRGEDRGRWKDAIEVRGSAVVVDDVAIDDVDCRGLMVESDSAVAFVVAVLLVADVLAVASDVVVAVLALVEREGEYGYM